MLFYQKCTKYILKCQLVAGPSREHTILQNVTSRLMFTKSVTVSRCVKTVNKYPLSLTNLRDALHHGKRAANKGGRSMS